MERDTATEAAELLEEMALDLYQLTDKTGYLDDALELSEELQESTDSQESRGHSFEVGDYAVDDKEPTASPEINTVEIVGLTGMKASEIYIDEIDLTVAESNPYYSPDDLVVKGRYPNMDSDKVWHFPEGRLRDV